jgi:hypothetical protein
MVGETNIGAKVSIAVDSTGTAPDAQNSDLTASGFGALTWEQIPNVGQLGDTGVTQNMVGYESWDNTLTVQQKGAAIGEQPELRALNETSNGMTALKDGAAISDQNNYAFKVEWPSGDIEYFRALIGPVRLPKGANEAFREVVCNLAINQAPIEA